MQYDLVESVPLSQENQDWVREEIRLSINPNGWRKTANWLRYWGLTGICITAFIALIAIVITLVIFAANRISQEGEFRGTTGTKLTNIDTHLTSVDTHLKDIDTTLLNIRTSLAAAKPSDKASIAQAKEVLATAQKNSIQLPPQIVEQSGKSFIAAASKEPAAWDAALRFVEYRSYLNLILNVVPSPGAPENTTTIYKVHGVTGFQLPIFRVAGLISKDKAARFNPIGERLTSNTDYGNQWIIVPGGGVLLDGYELKNVVFNGVHVVYMGGPIRMENVYFVGCTFDFARDAHGQQMAADILSSPAVSLAIS